MNNVLKSIKLDHFILKPRYASFLIIFAVDILITALAKQPGMGVAISIVISGVMISTIFSLYEKNSLNKLYGILPIGKSEVVIGRYLFALIIVIINGIISVIIAYILSLIVNTSMSQLEFLTYLSGAFLYFCFMISILFPLYFRFAFSKIYVFSNVPFYLTFVGIMLITKKTDVLKNLQQTIQYFTSHQYMICVTGFGIGLILLLISCFIACQVNKKTEL